MNQLSFNKARILEISFLIFVSLILYARVYQFNFVWDDFQLIPNNPYFLQKFDWLNAFRKSFWTFSGITENAPYYRPLVTIAFWMETKLWGFNPGPFHAVNLLMHLVSLAMLWILTFRFQFSAPCRMITCLLFALHPAQVSCVAFISCHGDLMVQMFGLLAILCWMGEGKIRWLAFLWMFLAMLSKEAGVILPFVLISYDIFVRNKSWKKIKTWIPVSVYAAYFSLRYWGLMDARSVPLSWNLLLKNQGAFRTFAYISRVIFPIPGSQDPILPKISPWITLLLFGMLIAIVYFIFQKSKRDRRSIFVWSWFFLTTLLIANWAGQRVRFSDQLLYIPMVPISLLIGSVIDYSKKTFYYLSGLLIVFASISFSIIPVWKDDYSFWKNELQYRPQDPGVLSCFAAAYNNYFKTEEACSILLKVQENLEKKYDRNADLLSSFNLGSCYLPKNPAKAEFYFQKILKISKHDWGAKNNLIISLAHQKKFSEALKYNLELVQEKPELSIVWENLGVTYANMENFPKAIEFFEKALTISPQNESVLKMVQKVHEIEKISLLKNKR